MTSAVSLSFFVSFSATRGSLVKLTVFFLIFEARGSINRGVCQNPYLFSSKAEDFTYSPAIPISKEIYDCCVVVAVDFSAFPLRAISAVCFT